MGQSRKKTPIGGVTTARSDKIFKTIEHRRERRHVAVSLVRLEEPTERDFGNPWRSQKDGKSYWADHDAKWMRK